MRQMEALLDGLQSFAATLVSTYESHIDTTRLCVRTPYLTIESLPNEIIHHIVKDAFVDHPRAASLIKYSHICSKFRDVILESPSLWSSITLYPSMPTGLMQTIIRRSSTLGLIVDIDIMDEARYKPYQAQPVRFSSCLPGLSTMFKQNHRWRKLLLRLDDDESAKILLNQFPRANLTSVRSLEVDDVGGLETDLFKKWAFPRLTELSWHSRKASPPMGMATQLLHHCTLLLGPSHLMNITTFLNAASGLRTLELQLELLAEYEPAESPKIRLSHLEHLEDFSSNDGFGTYAPLLKGILCPGLKHLTFIAGTPANYYALSKDMRGRYPVLTSFTLLIIARDDVKQVFSFEDILCSLPNTIKSLKIVLDSGDRTTLYASQRDNNVPRNLCISYPNLTDLYFFNKWRWDNMLEEDFYAKLCQVLKRCRVSLNHFGPGVGGRENAIEKELDKKNAIMTLQRAGVLSVADMTLAS